MWTSFALRSAAGYLTTQTVQSWAWLTFGNASEQKFFIGADNVAANGGFDPLPGNWTPCAFLR
jgi:hypothetical protein